MEDNLKTDVEKFLAADHSELDELLDKLSDSFESGDARQIYQRLDIFWARLAMHIRAEHLHLFPALLGALESFSGHNRENIPSLSRAQSVIEQLQNDHNFFMRELSEAVKLLRVLQENKTMDDSNRFLTVGAVYEKVVSVGKRLKAHNEIEEIDVYQWADSLFDATARAALNEQIKRELENLPPRFQRN